MSLQDLLARKNVKRPPVCIMYLFPLLNSFKGVRRNCEVVHSSKLLLHALEVIRLEVSTNSNMYNTVLAGYTGFMDHPGISIQFVQKQQRLAKVNVCCIVQKDVYRTAVLC